MHLNVLLPGALEGKQSAFHALAGIGFIGQDYMVRPA